MTSELNEETAERILNLNLENEALDENTKKILANLAAKKLARDNTTLDIDASKRYKYKDHLNGGEQSPCPCRNR